MKYYLTESFNFEAAHRIDGLGKANARIHGHSYKVTVKVSGQPNEQGILISQDDFRGRVERIVKKLDHQFLNEILPQTTAESIARHLFLILQDDKLGRAVKLESVKVGKVGMEIEVMND